MTTIVLLNGPPYAGKDTLADHMICSVPRTMKRRMAHELKIRTHRLYDCPEVSWDTSDYYDPIKDAPSPDFLGLTPRQAYIAVSEKLFKPMHGEEIFGELFLQWLKKRQRGLMPDLVMVPDSGFATEFNPIIREVGRDRVLLIRIHANRRGKSFAGDSRSHIHIPGVESVDLFNDTEGDPSGYLAEGESWIRNMAGLWSPPHRNIEENAR